MKVLQKLLGRNDINFNGRIYMRRWLLPQQWLPAWFAKNVPGIRLHNICASDEDRALHDHPFDFISVILKGGYFEHLADGSRTWHGKGSVLFRKAETLHRLELMDYEQYDVKNPGDGWVKKEESAWTFVIRGRIRRPWGFMTAKGWVHWKLFGPAGSTS